MKKFTKADLTKDIKAVDSALGRAYLEILKKKIEAFPQLLFLYAIALGLVLNLSANVIDDMFKSYSHEVYKIYAGSVLILAFIGIIFAAYVVNTIYISPLEKAKKDLDKNKKQLLSIKNKLKKMR